MAEETNTTQETQVTQQPQEAAPSAPAKKKKVNKLGPEQLNKKIIELENSGQVKSKYYKALVLRRREIEQAASR